MVPLESVLTRFDSVQGLKRSVRKASRTYGRLNTITSTEFFGMEEVSQMDRGGSGGTF